MLTIMLTPTPTIPTPFSLLCSVLLCLPLALIFFTFTASFSSFSPSPSQSLQLQLLVHNYNNNIIDVTNNHTKLLPLIITSNSNTNITSTTALILTPPPAAIGQYDDKDDELLFIQAARVDPNPKTPKKLAFMFLTTTPLPFAPLWELFFARAPKSFYNIYVHAHPTVNYTPPFDGVFRGRLIPSSKPTRRHTPTLISAARRLLAHALLDDASNSMFALLSPSCIPIRSFDYTYGILMRWSRRSFIEILAKEPGAHDRWAARGEEAMKPEVEYKDFRIGSQFWVVKRKHAWMIVRDRRVWSKFRMPCLREREAACYPEEQYFPTLLSMLDRRGCIACTLTHVEWKGGHGGHPRMYGGDEVGPELIWALRNKKPRYGNGDDVVYGEDKPGKGHPFLFARKFSPDSETVRRLITMANAVIFMMGTS